MLEPTQPTLQQIMTEAREANREVSKRVASGLLRERLSRGPQMRSVMHIAGIEAGVPLDVLEAVRKAQGVVEYQDEFGELMWRIKG